MSILLSGQPRDRDGFVAALFAWLSQRGDTHYDPGVTQLEHALQAARLAEIEGASADEIIAALLHDVGHLRADEHRGHADFLARDVRHEQIGANWLEPLFGPAVADPVRRHVAAKRYLCATDPAYWAALSPASLRSMEIQGGRMSADEAARFAALPSAAAALALRRRDDRAKAAGLKVPELGHYAARLRDCLRIGA